MTPFRPFTPPEVPSTKAPCPPYKFADNLHKGEFIFPPEHDEPKADPVCISDITHNPGLMHGGKDILVVDTAGIVYGMWRTDKVRMYWPAQELKLANARADADQPPGAPGASR